MGTGKDEESFWGDSRGGGGADGFIADCAVL